MTYSARVVAVTTSAAVRLDTQTSKTKQTLLIVPSVDIRTGPTSDVTATAGATQGTLTAAGGVKSIRMDGADQVWAIAVSTNGTIDVDQVDTDE